MKNKGFSLVELIVVIAIMAILVGVAVPVYTSYISKAQQSKDIQMIDEIKHAMEIYSAANGAGAGWVVLTPNGAIGDEGFGADAMAATFGDDWAEKLSLSWDEWKSSTDFLDMAAADAENLLDSSYLTGSNTEALLGEVSELTDAAFGMVGERLNDPSALYNTITLFFGDELVSTYFDSKEVEVEGAVVKQFDYSDEDAFKTQLSNFLVLAVADSIAETNPTGEQDRVTSLIGRFAMANAFANSEYATPEVVQAYETLKSGITVSNSSIDTVEAALDAFESNDSFSEELALYMGIDPETEAPAGQVVEDAAAFQHMMKTLAQLRDSGKLTSDSIKDPDLYSTGTIANYFNSYVASAGIIAKLGSAEVAALKAELEANPGSVAVFISDGRTGCTDDSVYAK